MTCSECGTALTDENSTHVSTMCDPCWTREALAEDHADGGHDTQPQPDCPDCNPER